MVALVAVGLEAPEVVDPQRAGIAVAVHEHDRRRRLLLADRHRRPQRGRAGKETAPFHSPPVFHRLMLAKEACERYAPAMTICCYVDSPVGRLALEADGETLTGVRWASAGERAQGSKPSPVLKEAQRQLERYFARRLKAFDLPLAARGTDFQKNVWKIMQEIPYGETATYGGIAMALAS